MYWGHNTLEWSLIYTVYRILEDRVPRLRCLLQAGSSEAIGTCYSSGPSGKKLQYSEVLGLADPWSQWSRPPLL